MDCTILAVDDEPANLRMLERLLRREYRVLTATSGEEALEVLKREDVSLIITDQRMPGLTGIELLRESLRTNPNAMRMILTGYTDPDALIEAINTTRVYKFVSKPWDPVHLKQTIADAVHQHRVAMEQKQLLEGLVSLVKNSPAIFSVGSMDTGASAADEVTVETVG
ncbi:MAG TPA: response regulator [Blastocatellia bacterium]|nr:response regulator [Blastocatellia bacterium]